MDLQQKGYDSIWFNGKGEGELVVFDKDNVQKVKQTAEENKLTPKETPPTDLKAELKKAKQERDKLSAKYYKLKDKLNNAPEHGGKGQVDINGNVAGSDVIDFGSDKYAKDLVNKAKQAFELADQKVKDLEKQIAKQEDEAINKKHNQQEMQFGEEIKPIGTGVFGNIYDQFRGKAKQAIDFLLRRKEGEAIGALHHPEIGDIDLVWGNQDYGLKKIVDKHPDMLSELQSKIENMKIVTSSDNRIVLESDTHRAIISKKLGETETNNWLLTAYEKKNIGNISVSSSDNETEPKGNQVDTAPLKNTSVISDNKDNAENQKLSGKDEINPEIKGIAKPGELKGITVINYLDNGETLDYGSKRSGVNITVKDKSASEIKAEIEFEKKILERTKRDVAAFDKQAIMNARGLTNDEKIEAIKMHNQDILQIEQVERIVLPFYEYHLQLKTNQDGKENKGQGDGQEGLLTSDQPSVETVKGSPSQEAAPGSLESLTDKAKQTVKEKINGNVAMFSMGDKGATNIEGSTTKEVADLISHLLSTGLAKEVRMVTPEEIKALLEGNEKFSVQERLGQLEKAAKFIRDGLASNVRGKSFTIELPTLVQSMIKRAMGRDYDSHNITINGVVHALNNHGIEGEKNTIISIPITPENGSI